MFSMRVFIISGFIGAMFMLFLLTETGGGLFDSCTPYDCPSYGAGICNEELESNE